MSAAQVSDLDPDDRSTLKALTAPWWIFLITGTLWIVVSWVVLRLDSTSVKTVGVIVGIVFLMAGLNEFLLSALAEGWRWLHALMGFVFLLGATWGFVEPKKTFFALASVIGLILFIKGTLTIIESVAMKHVNDLWWLGLIVGIFEILLGLWASQRYYPARAALILVWVGFAAMFRGITEIVAGFQMRSLHKSL